MGYIVGNIDKKQYIRPEAFGEPDALADLVDSYQGVMMGLIVLLADGNNRGGGDLRSDHRIIGSWAGDRIVIVDDDALMPEAAEPGMADVPLKKQLLTLGADVSATVIEAILQGEGDYCRLSQLNSRHVLPLVAQSRLQNAGGGAVLTTKGRATPLAHLEDLFAMFGEPMPLASRAREAALTRGINAMAELLGRPERVTVSQLQTEAGKKTVPSLDMWARQDDTQVVSGVKAAAFVVTDASGQSRRIELRFGLDDGTTVQALYEMLFAGIEFERSDIEGVKSPEVAKLLSFLKDSPKGGM